MRSDVIFDSLHLDRFLYIGWSIVVIMLSLMEDTFGSIWSLSCLAYWCLIDFWVWRQFIEDIGFVLWLCIIYSHWGIFPPSLEIPICYCAVWLSLFMVIEMFGWFWQTLYCTSDIHTRAYSPLLDEIVHRWMIIVGCLSHNFDIRLSTLGHIPLSSMRLCLGSGTRMDDHC